MGFNWIGDPKDRGQSTLFGECPKNPLSERVKSPDRSKIEIDERSLATGAFFFTQAWIVDLLL
jgi:hypothetical protein